MDKEEFIKKISTETYLSFSESKDLIEFMLSKVDSLDDLKTIYAFYGIYTLIGLANYLYCNK